MASYDQNFNQMQEEALARLRDMQRRSRTAVNRPHQNPPSPPQNDNHRQNQEHVHNHETTHQHGGNRPQPQPPPSHNHPQDIIKSLLGDVKIDSEKALILMMLYVLYKNKADMKLLLALGYLLI